MPSVQINAHSNFVMESRPSNGDVSRNNIPDVNFRTSPGTSLFQKCRKCLTVPQEWQNAISVAVLCFINLINYMDRFTIAGILKKIKVYYAIDDSMGGLIQTVFVCSYMILAPLFGYLGDRYSRKYIIMFGILFWSATTLAGSFIPHDHFWAFLLLRGMVGIGEASYSTLAPTIISDLYVGKLRSYMLTVFYFAIPFGSGLGYIVGSNITKALGEWQWSLRMTPALGVIAIITLLLFLKEPPHGESEGGTNLTATDWKTDLKILAKNKSFMWSTAGFTCVAFVVGGLAWWAPLFMTYGSQVSGDDSSEATVDLIFGVITCIAGVVGVALGSGVSNKLKAKFPNSDPLVCGIGMLIGTPFLFASAITANKCIRVSWAMIFIGEVLFCMNWPLVADILLYVVVPTRRGMAEAVQMVASHALGDAISPYIIGSLSDAISDGKTKTNLVKFHSLQYSLFMTTFISVLGGMFFLFSALYIVKDKDRATRITKGEDDVNSLNGDGMTEAVSSTDVRPLIA